MCRARSRGQDRSQREAPLSDPKHAATARISRHGREGISYPYSLAADYAADLLKRVARAEPERINAREWIILLYSAVFILVTWFLAVLLAIYNRNASPTGLKARRALLLHYMVTFNTGQRRMSLPAQQLLKLPYGPQHAEDS